MRVRRILTHEGPRLRAIRLRALADAPAAFGSVLAEEERRPPEFWDQLAEETAVSAAAVVFVAEDDDRWDGIVRGFVHRDYPGIVRLASMWVDPDRRRFGIGNALVRAVLDWARTRRATCVQLWVTEANTPARALYGRHGFAPTAHVKPLPSRPALREILLVRGARALRRSMPE